MHSNLPFLQLRKPRIEELEVLDRNLLWCSWDLRRLIGLARALPEGILEVAIDRVVTLPLSLGQREDVEVELLALQSKTQQSDA